MLGCTVAIGCDVDIYQAFVVRENQFHVQFNGLDLHVYLKLLVDPAPGDGRITVEILEEEIFLLDHVDGWCFCKNNLITGQFKMLEQSKIII